MTIMLMLTVIVVDQLTKLVASLWSWSILNPGISFGLLSSLSQPVLSLLLLGVILASWYAFRHSWEKAPLAAGFFMGGAISNLLDRIFLAGVRDWLPLPGTQLHNNLADYAITVGLIALVYQIVKHEFWPTKPEKEQE